jgi:hypothetical protein
MINVKDFIYMIDDKNLSKFEQEKKYEQEKENYKFSIAVLKKDLKVDIIYEIDSNIYILRISNSEATLILYNHNKSKKVDLRANFYTIVTNYSHYSFNQNFDKKYWIKGIFHKNDGYQMPIVINPYRKNGNIDINNESILTRARLLSNILSIHNYDDVNPKSKIKYVSIIPNTKKINNLLDKRPLEKNLILYRKEFLIPLFKKKFNKHYTVRGDSEVYSIFYILEIYLIEKIKTITKRYQPYYKFKEFEKNPILKNEYFDDLIKDRSHITLKVNQVLNYFNENIYFDHEEVITRPIAIDIKKTREILSKKPGDTTQFLVPSIFDSEIIFEDESSFENLSSGEKQKIYSLNSIIYHLRNIDSVHNIKNTSYITYTNANLILDEIELYYHPKIQKSTINDFIDLIKNVNFQYLKNLNIIFLTHSPLILSDIINNNVLYLNKAGKGDNKLSFAANIVNLYADSFFIGDYLIGDYARNKIDETINWLNELLEQKKNKNYLKPNYSLLEKKKHRQLIEIIDEPIIKSKLLEMYSEIFSTDERIIYLEKERIRIEKEIEKLKSE